MATDYTDHCLALTRTQEIFLGSFFFLQTMIINEESLLIMSSTSNERSGKSIHFLNLFTDFINKNT